MSGFNNGGGYRPKSRNERYNNAYGNYRGGYGPCGDFGPPGPCGPPPLFGPPPGPMFGPPGPMMWGRGFGPNGPPMRRLPMDDRAVKYLIRCGVSKDHLKGLPKQLFQMIDPEYCGICAMELESFSMSRLHYTSKNHFKAQKKWLSQRSEGGIQRAREVPLKSRDLYCELCDVHITSKNHAESHYAGKPHRAIVKGQKNPKNSVLLQRGMEDRLEQLIRREKKFIKSIDTDNEDTAKETKPIQADLYCDICKTSVTCSEQMTLHLNGKRHLNKEKQHILKVMKGEVDPAEDNDKKIDDDTTAIDSEGVGAGEGEDVGSGDGAAANSGEGGAANSGDGEAVGSGDPNDDWGNEQWEETQE